MVIYSLHCKWGRFRGEGLGMAQKEVCKRRDDGSRRGKEGRNLSIGGAASSRARTGDPLAASRLSFFPFAFSRAQPIDGNRVSG